MDAVKPVKVYVPVDVRFDENGRMLPHFITWEDGRRYEIDRVTGTEYYKTLFWLLVNNYHAAETAKTLFIHRNTLKYRVDKITQLMDVDIYDGDVSAYLRFCYALMLEDFPPDVGDRTKQQDEPGE